MWVGSGLNKKAVFSSLSTLLTVLFFMVLAPETSAASSGELRMTKNELQSLLLKRAHGKQKQFQWVLGGGRGEPPALPGSEIFLENDSDNEDATMAMLEFYNALQTVVVTLLRGGPFEVDGEIWDGRPALQLVMRLLDTQGVFVTKLRIHLDGVPKDLINDAVSGTVVIYLPAWVEASFAQKQLLAVHEILGLLAIPDESYQISSQWLARYRRLAKRPPLPSALKDFERPKALMPRLLKEGSFSNETVLGSAGTSASFGNILSGPGGEMTPQFRPCLRRDDGRADVKVTIRFDRPGVFAKRIFVNWMVRCRLSETEEWAVGPIFDGDDDPSGWFGIQDSRLVRNGVEVGWISGTQLYVKAKGEILNAEIRPSEEGGLVALVRVIRFGASFGHFVMANLNQVSEAGPSSRRGFIFQEDRP